MREILEEVLQRIKPTDEERKKIDETVRALERKIGEELCKRGFEDVEIKLVGSVAKDTYLRGDVDIDFFLLFPQNYSEKEIAYHTLSIGKKILENYEEKYAQHPYARGRFNGFSVDIVPSYKIETPEELRTAVDRTPLHTEYVRKNLSDEQKDDVRLLKAFMKGIGVYGAEVKVGGFSGYLCELLVIKYRSFLKVLENASKWRKHVLIFIERKPERKFEKTPLIFVDPVDARRNAAAAVREESYYKFILASKSFLKKPTIDFFFPKELKGSIEDLKKYIEKTEFKVYIIKIIKPEVVEDVLHSQLQKFSRIVHNILKKWEFLPRNVFYFLTEKYVYLIFSVERDSLPKAKVHEGPPVWTDNAVDFVEKWSSLGIEGPYIENSRLYAIIPQKIRSLKDVLYHELRERDIGSHLNRFKNSMEITPLNSSLENLRPEEIEEIYRGLLRKLPWMV